MIGGRVGPWVTLVALGAFHGVNPGMGWLLAAGIGMQRESRVAVWRAFVPIAMGHVAAIAGTLLVASALGAVLPSWVVRWGTVLLLVGLDYRNARGHRHGAPGGMRMGSAELGVWSFLIAIGHGAGLMVLPVAASLASPHSAHLATTPTVGTLGAATGGRAAALFSWNSAAATLAHSAGFMVASAMLAAIVYECAALHLLRRAWVNLDLVWTLALLVTAGVLAMR